jgi:hypothetical protein
MNKEEYINDVNDDYKWCNIINTISFLLFCISVIISLILCYKYNELLCKFLIVLHVAYFIIVVINNVFLFNRAENERRKTNLQNAFESNLTEKRTKNFYTNDEFHSIKKFFVNEFESVYYTKNNLNKNILFNTIKALIEIIIWIIIVINTNDKNIILSVTQTIFSTEILESYVKYLYYISKSNRIYDDFYRSLITKKYSNDDVALLLSYCFQYECLKASTQIMLSDKTFKNNNSIWSSGWKRIKQKIK